MAFETSRVDGDALAAQLLATKLLVPPLALDVVARPRLVEDLVRSEYVRKTIVELLDNLLAIALK
jgi:hypothetical protein